MVQSSNSLHFFTRNSVSTPKSCCVTVSATEIHGFNDVDDHDVEKDEDGDGYFD